MELSVQEFYHGFRQELMAGAEASNSFQLSEFMETMARELSETGFIEDFNFCHYRARRGMRVDGYWFSDEEETLDLYIADFESRNELMSLTQTDTVAMLKRLTNFFDASRNNELFRELEETSPEYGLARAIFDRRNLIRRINLFLISERLLSERFHSLEISEVGGVPAASHIWDISRLQRQRSSRDHKEVLDFDITKMFGQGIPCLRAHLGSDQFPSYLAVLPGHMLSVLYDKFGTRLLEQNVRTFLQARGKVNKGIRTTILNEPDMFFAYNNGITATAQEVDVESADLGLEIIRIKDFQIVNGGQTTASLFHTKRRDNASLEGIFIQMKLSIVNSDESESIVPRISEYANTQNRVNAADFFSNHQFHVRLQEFSRRIWAPAQHGEQRETKWYYERVRGQYADEQSKLTRAEIRRFRAEYPRHQMFTKTDLAKFENVWDEHPKWVNLGAQKNFAQYAKRIGNEWEVSSTKFNEQYYKTIVSKAILFRKTERLVSNQTWYQGGYRANVVAYTLAVLALYCKKQKKLLNFDRIWDDQDISNDINIALEITSKFVHDIITQTPEGISNVTEWCKRDGCWDQLKSRMSSLDKHLPKGFEDGLIEQHRISEKRKSAERTQKIDNGIKAQEMVIAISGEIWKDFLNRCLKKSILSPKEISILKIAAQIPRKIPSEHQSMVLIQLIDKAYTEGIKVDQ